VELILSSPPTEQVVEASFSLEVDDILALAKRARSQFFGLRLPQLNFILWSIWIMFAVGFGAMLFAMVSSGDFPGRHPALTIAIGLLVTIFGWSILPHNQAGRIRRMSEGFQKIPQDMVLVVGPRNVDIRTADTRSECSWTFFHYAEETASHFFLFTSRLRAVILPKRALRTQVEIDAVREVVRRRVANFISVQS
jgi:YcxB-like protein